MDQIHANDAGAASTALAAASAHLPKPTAFQGMDKSDEVTFYCSVPNASMHREDGTKLPFVGGYFTTNLKASIRYLRTEIENGNNHLREVTGDELQAAKDRANPLIGIEAKIREKMEAEYATKLQQELQKLVESGKVPIKPAKVVVVPPPAIELSGAEKLAILREEAAKKALEATRANAPISGI